MSHICMQRVQGKVRLGKLLSGCTRIPREKVSHKYEKRDDVMSHNNDKKVKPNKTSCNMQIRVVTGVIIHIIMY